MKSKVFEDIFLVSASTLLLLLWSIRYVQRQSHLLKGLYADLQKEFAGVPQKK